MKQCTPSVLMIRPAEFRGNEQTAVNNYYQSGQMDEGIAHKALLEFDRFHQQLVAEGIEVHVVQTPQGADTPDSLFPNNWISFHECIYVRYSMFAENRRREKNIALPSDIMAGRACILDLQDAEDKGMYLEGTGSLVLDRLNKVAYAAISPRTDAALVRQWAHAMNYSAVCFHAYQQVGEERKLIYHTNVMMSIGPGFAWICWDTIDQHGERHMLENSFRKSGLEVIAISEAQVNAFAGNILTLRNRREESVIVMSQRAHDALRGDQLEALSRFGKCLVADIPTIETHGGGSVRCMLAEVF